MAPPISSKSVIFIAASIAIIEIKDIPIAVLNAKFSFIYPDKIIVSSIIEVISPLKIDGLIVPQTGQGIPENWKNAIVPRFPIEQPTKHQGLF